VGWSLVAAATRRAAATGCLTGSGAGAGGTGAGAGEALAGARNTLRSQPSSTSSTTIAPAEIRAATDWASACSLSPIAAGTTAGDGRVLAGVEIGQPDAQLGDGLSDLGGGALLGHREDLSEVVAQSARLPFAVLPRSRMM
jgi:hypothetical protein